MVSCGALTHHVQIHNSAVVTWQQIISKSGISDIWKKRFKAEFDLLHDLAKDARITLNVGGLTLPNAEQRMLHVFGGGKSTDAELKLPVVVTLQRLHKLLRMVACSMWPQMFDALQEVSACKMPDLTCMSKVWSSSLEGILIMCFYDHICVV